MWKGLKVKLPVGRHTRKKVDAGVPNSTSTSSDRCRLHRLDNSGDDAKEEAYPVDVIAIHGLNGDPYRTWTHENKSLWLAEFLPRSLPGARVYSFGYDSAVFFSRSKSDVGDFARSLLSEIVLTRDLDKDKHRPIVFVCHSMGGIVLKKSLVIAHEESRYANILRSTKAVAFFGTPHGGSDKAGLGSILANILNTVESVSLLELALGSTRSDLVKILGSRSTVLEEVSLSFRNRANDIEIVSFYETRASPPFKTEIVPRVSAIVGVNNEELIPIIRDHRTICRFENEQDSAYRRIVQICQKHAKPDAQRTLNDREHEFLKSLDISFIDDVRAAFPARVRGTCEWLLSDSQFRKWSSIRHSSVLWICGDAGCGKTALMSFLVDEIKAHMSKVMSRKGSPKVPILVCSFFCDDKDADRKHSTEILRSLLFQIFCQRHDLIRHATSLLATFDPSRSISFSQLWQVLEAVLKDPVTGYVCVIVDALDECEEKSRHLFLNALYGFMAQDHGKAASVAKIILSGRPLVSITDEIDSNTATIWLWENGRRNKIVQDVELVIKDHIQQVMLRSKASEMTIGLLADRLSKKANGTFLWVVLVLARLANSFHLSPFDLERIVREIPPNLDSLYRRFLAEIEAEPSRDFAVRALQIVVAAFRPLTLAEFRYAIAIQSEHRTLEALEQMSEPDLHRTLRGVLGPLVHIYESRVYLVHQSAKDFLICYRSGSLNQQDSAFAFDMEATSNSLSMSCITFLGLTDFAESPVVNENLEGLLEMPEMQDEPDLPLCHNHSASPASNPQLSENLTAPKDGTPEFFEYASLYWAKHFASCPKTASQDLVEAAIILSDRNTTLFTNWSEQFRRSSRDSVTLPPVLDPFLVAAYFGQIHVIEYLLKRNLDEFSLPQANQALTWAARMGNYDVVKCLLSCEEDVSGALVEGGSPLCWASRNGHAKVVNLILGNIRGSQVNARDHEGRTPLSHAVGNGHLDIVQLLLDSPDTDVNNAGRRGRTPIFWAVGQEPDQVGLEILRLLVFDGRADLRHRDSQGRTILSLAAESGDVAVVEFLLDHKGPAVEDLLNDVGDNRGRSPLSWAAYHGQIAIVEMLCLSGKVNAQLKSVDQQGQNAISLAADRNEADIIKFLVQFDPDGVDLPDKDGQTPLSWAMWTGGNTDKNIRTVRTLLQTGLVKVDSQAHNGRTPLSFAAAAGRPDLVRMLVQEGGADLDKINDSDLIVDWRSSKVKEEMLLLRQEIPSKT